MPGLPGLRGTDHIGITVPDIDEAHDFLTRVIGCTYFYSLGPYESTSDYMSQQFGTHPRSSISEARFYRMGNGANLEVFQWSTPDTQQHQPIASDIGGHHIALYVDDLDVAVEHLQHHGVEILGEVQASSGPGLGQRWVYFRSPWGMQCELLSYPTGKAYASVDGMRLWSPANSETEAAS